MAYKLFVQPFVTMPVAPIITGTILHFRFHICCICIHTLLYFSVCYYYYYYYHYYYIGRMLLCRLYEDLSSYRRTERDVLPLVKPVGGS
jgi:hypothetical protein